jgi:hypothetical protein
MIDLTRADRRLGHDRPASLSLQYRFIHILRSLYPFRGAIKSDFEEIETFNMAQPDHGTLG